MKVSHTALSGVFVIEPTVFEDERGHFFESLNQREFHSEIGLNPAFVQDCQSLSCAKNTLRGLHLQLAPKAQGKLVSVVCGSVQDVVVDCRAQSPSFGAVHSIELTGANHLQLWIPPGLAHGFLTLEDNTIFQYKVTDYWSPEHERCIAWDDLDLAIEWKLESQPLLSERDSKAMSWKRFIQDMKC